MAIEDHLLSLVKNMKTMTESVVETVKKVVDEISQEKYPAPAAPKSEPAPATDAAQPVVDEILPGWELVDVVKLADHCLFRFRGATHQRLGNSGYLVRDENGKGVEMVRARCLENNLDRTILFHPLCKVLAKK